MSGPNRLSVSSLAMRVSMSTRPGRQVPAGPHPPAVVAAPHERCSVSLSPSHTCCVRQFLGRAPAGSGAYLVAAGYRIGLQPALAE